MSLRDYSVFDDHFRLEADRCGELSFPCRVCRFRHGRDNDPPCRTCGHNANAVRPEPPPVAVPQTAPAMTDAELQEGA